jgi:hypothetical protein
LHQPVAATISIHRTRPLQSPDASTTYAPATPPIRRAASYNRSGTQSTSGPTRYVTASQTANAANAQLSTGPRTDRGTRQSSQNSRTHGLTAQHPVISEKDGAAFDQLREQLHAETKPQGALQQIIFEELIDSAWNLRRVRAMEAELNTSAPDALLSDDDASAAKFDRLARHHTRIERAFFRSLRELKALQTDAALSLTLPPYFMKIAPPLASRAQIAKRTQFLATNDRVLEAEDYQSAWDLEDGALGRVLYHHTHDAAAEPAEVVTSAH